MLMKHACLIVAGLIVSANVLAAGGNPAGVSPMTSERAPGIPALHVPNDADRLFIQQAGMGAMSEVESGRIASKQSGPDDIRAFAQRMVDDHTKVDQQLAALASSDHLRLPDTLDLDHRAAMDDLRKRRGTDFDRTYLGQQIAAHQETLHLLEWQLAAGQDDTLKDFAKINIPVVLEHLRMAIDLQQQVASRAPFPPAQIERDGSQDARP
jgi:putative membrane protein